FEVKSVRLQAAGYDPAALENQLRLRSQEHGAELEHPPRRRQTDRSAPGLPEVAHKLGIGKGKGRGDVHRALKLWMRDEPVNRRDEIGVVNPGNELPAV